MPMQASDQHFQPQLRWSGTITFSGKLTISSRQGQRYCKPCLPPLPSNHQSWWPAPPVIQQREETLVNISCQPTLRALQLPETLTPWISTAMTKQIPAVLMRPIPWILTVLAVPTRQMTTALVRPTRWISTVSSDSDTETIDHVNSPNTTDIDNDTPPPMTTIRYSYLEETSTASSSVFQSVSVVITRHNAK
jgi:hypothetical protein